MDRLDSFDINRLMNRCPITKITSGGQAGVDRAALDVAIELQIPHGGWCPKGRIAEDGVISTRYLLQETNGAQYEERTRQNVMDADGTLVLDYGHLTGGTKLTTETCYDCDKPLLVLNITNPATENAPLFWKWIGQHTIRTLNVAGSRESKYPIYQQAREHFLELLTSFLD